jgi:SAM-dependent methyltransferase
MIYDESYAQRYRDHDDSLDDSTPYLDLVRWLQSISATIPPGFTALDLGCGTGRYFWAIAGARRLVGLDASAPMLQHAQHPVHGDRIRAEDLELVQGDLATHVFAPQSFDLVYSVGVLAEHVALDEALVARVSTWLRGNGRFAFTTVHPDSPSVPQTMPRRAGRLAAHVLPSTAARPLRTRLLSHGRYADEARIRELLAERYTITSLERFVSEAHLHCRCVAVKQS